MKLHITIVAAVCLVTFSSQAQTLFSADFTGDTPGSNPSGWTSVTPAVAVPGTTNGSLGATVVSVSGNNQLNLFDYTSAGSASVRQDFLPVSAVHLSLNFGRNPNGVNISPSGSNQGLFIALGLNGVDQTGNNTNRAADIRLLSDGNYSIDSGLQNANGTYNSTPGNQKALIAGDGGANFPTHTLDFYAYSGTVGGSLLSYTGPDALTHTLGPKAFDIWIDGTRIVPLAGKGNQATGQSNFGFFTGNYYNSTYFGQDASLLGEFAFFTGPSATTNTDFLVDNVMLTDISTVPEPSTLALLGLGGLLLIGGVRRSRRSR